jgi:hypothetical protein
MNEITQQEALRQAVAPEDQVLKETGTRWIQQALDYRVGESPSKAPLPPPLHPPVVRAVEQIHVRVQRRSSGR